MAFGPAKAARNECSCESAGDVVIVAGEGLQADEPRQGEIEGAWNRTDWSAPISHGRTTPYSQIGDRAYSVNHTVALEHQCICPAGQGRIEIVMKAAKITR